MFQLNKINSYDIRVFTYDYIENPNCIVPIKRYGSMGPRYGIFSPNSSAFYHVLFFTNNDTGSS